MNRKNFYKDEFSLERAESSLNDLISKCTLDEILWIVRNVTYDQIAYYSDESKGIVYDGSYTEENIEQATMLQKAISTYCDLFGQSINKRVFDQGYLNTYDLLQSKIKIDSLELECAKLREEVSDLKEELDYEKEK
jgi:hypothetical protein